ncbi:glycosyltransferase [Streptococcus parasanguinis]|uniref:glycosyltransferase family 2 protein n=1 Tax=Streptococcus parasanguinis TaxID=1318 RepID=UPI0012BC8F59|nr:glycosyltransferase [Streptococcus parasanguinis]MTR65211.1 glycosyltransferase [Streptococcus parasanguinis]MTR69112.1 glycosyltransferase [Streptococcus parasanguinis]MTS05707.1 glycosyltransferase [Streptococcus parasanguinis]
MKYSVIIPVYNVEKYIDRCLKSIISQNYDDLEIIVIDNGSTDSSGSICDTYASEYSNISVYHIENHGVSAARNFGLAKAQGEFICFVDADDYLVGNLFSNMENQLDSELDLLVFSYYNSLEKNLSETTRSAKILPIEGKKDRNQFIALFTGLFLSDMMYTVWNKIYRREFLEEHRIMFEQYELGEDVRFNLNVFECVHTISFSKTCYYVYVSGRTNSAMGQYNPYRMSYQLEELEKVDQLMTGWDIHDDQFIDQIKARILMSNIQNISNQKMSLSKKRHYVEVLCRNQEMIALLKKATSPLHPLVRRLLHFRMYLTVIFLKKLQTLIK